MWRGRRGRAARIIPMPIDGNAVLLIIDVQRAMDDPVWGPRNNPGLVSTLQIAVERWRRLGRRVWWIADDSSNSDSPYHPDQPGHEFLPELSPAAGENVVHKRTGSAFAGTDLEQRLHAAGVDTLVVGGFMTNKCVESSVRSAADLGFSVYVLADGTSAVGHEDLRGRWWEAEDVHHMALANMRGPNTRIVQSADLFVPPRPEMTP